MTEKKQESLEGYVKELEKQIEKGFIGLISEVNPITNTLFFGEENRQYDERNGFGITIKVKGNEDVEFTQWFSKPEIRGWEQSNLYAFKQKYGSVPKKGQEVECHIDENGFFRVTI